jgi:hypothetical protein
MPTRADRSAVIATGLAVAAALLVLGPISAVPAIGTGPSSVGTVDPLAGPPAASVRPDAFALGTDGITPAAISLNWSASTAAEFLNYSVFESSQGEAGPWRFITAITAEGTTTVGVANLDPGGTYWWNVTAYSTSLLGLGGTVATYSTILDQTQPTLAYLTSPSNTTSSINLVWTNNGTYGGVLSFGSYAVEEIDNGVSSTAANITVVGDNLTTVTGLLAGHSYWFYIDTYDGCSDCVPSGDSVTESNVVHTGTATPLVGVVRATRTTVDVRQLVGFTCTPSGGTPPYTFGWNFTGGDLNFSAGPGTTSQSYPKANASGELVFCKITDHAGTSYVPPAVTIIVNRDLKIAASASPLNVTTGSSVAFACEASRGTAPLTVGWTLGDGGTLAGIGDDANGSASYSSAGSYVAHCTVTDGAGARADASVVIHVSARSALAWLTPAVVLGLASAAGAALALAVGVLGRRGDRTDQSSAMARWIPPTGPATTVYGAKICPKCGASNVPLRRSCSVCGTPLPRHPGP